jgi:hypothetical protein
MPRLALSLLAVLAFAVAAGCSSVSVRVIDDANGTSVEAAKVAWTDAAKRSGSVSTDWRGEAVLFAPGPIRSIRVTKDGYKPASQEVQSEFQIEEIEIRLVPVGGERSGFEKER